MTGPKLLAQFTETWDGGGGDDNWTTGNNWADNSAPANPQGNVNFAGSTRPTPNNNFSAYSGGFRIFFNSGATNFILNGNPIKFFDFGGARARIQNDGTNTQTINLRVGAGNSSGGLDFLANAGDIIYDGGTIDGGTAFLDGGSQMRFDGNAGKTVIFNKAIVNGDSAGSVAIRSNTIVVLNANNNYSAGTFMDAGQLWISTNANVVSTLSLGPTASRPDNAGIFINTVTGGKTVTNSVTVRSGGSGTLTLGGFNTSGENTYSGNITLQKAVSLSAATGGSLKFSGVISESSGGLGATIGTTGNEGTVLFDNAMTYTGPTAVSFGTLKLNAANRISDASALSVAAGATFDLNNNAETVGSIAGAGSISMGTAQFIAGQNNSSTTFSGIMSGTSAGSFVKKGTGTLTLSGANTYAGRTFIVGGTLSFNVDQDAAFNGTNFVGETSGADSATLAIGASGVILLNPVTVRSGSSGAMTIAANNTSGTATIGGPVAIQKAATLSANAGGALSLTNVVGLNGNRLTVAGAHNTSISGEISGAGDLLKQGTGTLTLGASNSFALTSAMFVDSGSVLLAASGAAGLNNAYVNVGASTLSASATLLISEDGVVISNPIDIRYFSSFPGAKTIGGNHTGGTATFAGNIALHDKASFTAAAGGTVRISGDISVSGGITSSQTNTTDLVLFNAGPGVIKTGGGTIEFTGNNSYSGETYVRDGTLQFNGSSSYGNSTVRLGDDVASSTVTVNIANPSGGGVVNGVINTRNGAGGTKTISASNVSGVNTYGGNIFFDSDATTLSASAGATLAFTSTVFNIKNFTLSVTGDGDTDISSSITNNPVGGSLTKTGDGKLTLSGSNTYSGMTTISGGTVLVNGSLAASSAVSVASGATLGGTGTIGGAVTVNGTIAPGTSIGTLTLNQVPMLNGVVSMELDKAAGPVLTADKLVLTSDTLAYGGALTVVASGDPLTGGEVFDLFDAPAFDANSAFTATNLPSLSAGLNWWLGNLVTNGTIVVNRAPLATGNSFTRLAGQLFKIAKADITANDTDADGNGLSVVSMDATTAEGVTLFSDDTFIYYTNTANGPDDSFNCVIGDGRGGFATNQVTVNVQSSVAGQVVSIINASGEVTVTFGGIPGTNYIVQTNYDSLSNPSAWGEAVSTNCPVGGIFTFTDDFGGGTPPPQAYYRLLYVVP